MNPIEVLRRARDMITSPDNWCTHRLFRERDGRDQYCVLGAINLVQRGEACFFRARTEEEEQALKLLDSVCLRLFGDDPIVNDGLGGMLIGVNNKLGHDAIMLALDTAIGDYPDHAIKEPAYKKPETQVTR